MSPYVERQGKSNSLKNSLAVKKGAALFKNGQFKRGGQETAVMEYMQVDDKNFNNNNSGEFCADSQ